LGRAAPEPGVPDGYRLLPAHPWQLTLLRDRLRDLSALRDGRLRLLGTSDRPIWPTSSVRTVCDPAADVFYKFSLDVQITNDIRRLWRYDLRWAVPLAHVLQPVYADVAAAFPGATFLVDRGYRTIDVGNADIYEGLAVVSSNAIPSSLPTSGPRPAPPSWHTAATTARRASSVPCWTARRCPARRTCCCAGPGRTAPRARTSPTRIRYALGRHPREDCSSGTGTHGVRSGRTFIPSLVRRVPGNQ
jgi:hypothetical protein